MLRPWTQQARWLTHTMLRPWSQQARQLTPQRGTVAHLRRTGVVVFTFTETIKP